MLSRVALATLPVRSSCMRQVVRTAVYKNSVYKPGPYPVTEEQRRAAAAKYNMDPADYKPYPDDGMGFGDYPDLPLISTEARSDYYPWDYPDLKRNFNEPIHVMEIIINDTRLNMNHRYQLPIWKQWICFLGAILSYSVVFFIMEDYPCFPTVGIKQLPADGTHYSFETVKKYRDLVK